MKHYCNPLNLEYRYQFLKKSDTDTQEETFKVFRESADPSMVLFKGLYYLFPSMAGGFYTSEDLHEWRYNEFLQDMPEYAYAPDVRVAGEYLYFCASKTDESWAFFRTKDPLKEPFEEMKGAFSFWDPNLLVDDDNRRYLYWGCSTTEPIYVVELDKNTMNPITEKRGIFAVDVSNRGYERVGEDYVAPRTEEEIKQLVDAMYQNMPKEQTAGIPEEEVKKILYGYMGNNACMEGPWVTKHQGKYYLQYAIPATEDNVYGDAVAISNSPMEGFKSAKNNPFSYKPGGFITAAGHGSTLEDKDGNFWHIASMRISHNHNFERRLGLWKSGFDEEGELYCDQRYGDWPIAMDAKAFSKPDWMLLSYNKKVRASSGNGMENVTDEDIRTFWKAGSNQPGEWIEIDLGNVYDVYAIQLNFQDDKIERKLPTGATAQNVVNEIRWIDKKKQHTRWLLEGSCDGEEYFVISDKREAETDYSHDFVELDDKVLARFIRLTIEEIPYQVKPCISGIRVFGIGKGEAPKAAEEVDFELVGDFDLKVFWKAEESSNANLLWGYAPDKLYHSRMIFGKQEGYIGALTKGQPIYIRVDTFNESGITEGEVIIVRA